MLEEFFGSITPLLQARQIDTAAKDFSRRYGCSLHGQTITHSDGSAGEALIYRDPEVGFSIAFGQEAHCMTYDIRKPTKRSHERRVSEERLLLLHHAAKDSPSMSKDLLQRVPWTPKQVQSYWFYSKHLHLDGVDELEAFVLAHIDYAVEKFGRE